jgi:ferredoxin
VWISDAFAYQTANGEARSVDLELTPADFLSHDIRFDDHFWRVEPSKWHEKMAPLGDYLRDGAAEAASSIPYLTAVDADGAVVRVVVSRAIVDKVRSVGTAWRGLRESGGVDNSFARAALDGERARLAAEKQREIDDLETKYAANLDRDLSALTQEIVGRIAAQLLADGAGTSAAYVPAAPRPAPANDAPVSTPEAPAAEEEEEEALPLGDPYIDTPLCTSCNECTKINAQMFAYDGNKQAFIKDAGAGTFRQLVMAAEKCPVKIIHPGKPREESESGLDELVKRAAAFN